MSKGALDIFESLLISTVGVHRLGFKLFGATVWELLIIELFSQ
jgi:hypothetical protein